MKIIKVQEADFYSIPVNLAILTFFWSIVSLLLPIPYNTEISAIILCICLSKIDFDQFYGIKLSNIVISLCGCISGLSWLYIAKYFECGHYNPSHLFYASCLILYLPVMSSLFLSFNTYFKSNIKNFEGPLFECLNKCFSERLDKNSHYFRESSNFKLDIFCSYSIIVLVMIMIMGVLTAIILSLPIVLTLISSIYIVTYIKNTSNHSKNFLKSLGKTIGLGHWDRPTEYMLNSSVPTSTYHANILKLMSIFILSPLFVLIIFGFLTDFSLLIISIPTICYFLIYFSNLYRKFNNKNTLQLNFYFFILCLLNIEIVVLHGLIELLNNIISTLNEGVGEFMIQTTPQNYIIKNSYSLMALNSVSAIILLLLEWRNKLKILNKFDLSNEHKIIISAIVSASICPFMLSVTFPNFFTLFITMYIVILLILFIPYNLEFGKFFKEHFLLAKVSIFVCCILSAIIMYLFMKSLAPTAYMIAIGLLIAISLILLGFEVLFAKKL